MIKPITPMYPALSAKEVLSHMRRFDTEEESLLEAYILAGQEDVESLCERSLCVRKFRLTLPYFPGGVTSERFGKLPFGNLNADSCRRSGNGSSILLEMVPVLKIDAVSYRDVANDAQEYDDYNLLGDFEPAQLYQLLDTSWPDTYSRPDAVTVTFWAGETIPLTVDVVANSFTSVSGYPFVAGDEITFSVSGNRNAAIGDVAVLPGGVAERTTYFVKTVTGSSFTVSATDGGAVIDLTAAASGSVIDKVFAGQLQPFSRLALLQIAAKAFGERCPTGGGCVCADEIDGNPAYRRLKWRSPAEFV